MNNIIDLGELDRSTEKEAICSPQVIYHEISLEIYILKWTVKG